MTEPSASNDLRREVGLVGALFMGLGSIVGTGLFVSLGIAAGVAGEGILLALVLAAVLALANGLSSAQLAAAHSVSGGTYEYGYRFLSPTAGYLAGCTFLLAKSASAATAALGAGGYLLLLLGIPPERGVLVTVGGGTTLFLTWLVTRGIRRSNQANLAIVGATLAAFVIFLAVGLPPAMGWMGDRLADDGATPFLLGAGPFPLLEATALLFVAFTGYGRIATLGEEVRDPARTIPRAIWLTLGVITVLYLSVALVALATLGADSFADATTETAAPLQRVAAALEVPFLAEVIGLAAITAMLGVLLNLVLGLSRVALAMGRRRDLPTSLAEVDEAKQSPTNAVLLVGAIILVLVLLGDVRTTWAFSAFTVLLYYGITNLAALRLPPEARLYPRWVAWSGLGGCVFLAFQVPPVIWGVGLVIVAVALGARALGRRGS